MDTLKLSKDVSVRDILLYSPYDMETDLEAKGFSIEDFKHFFIELKEFKENANKLISFIQPGDKHKNIVLISGYSGSGKTTFLHWFQNNTQKNHKDIFLDIVNLNSILPISEANTNLLEKAIKLELKKILKNPLCAKLIIDNIDLLRINSTNDNFLSIVYDFYKDVDAQRKQSDENLNKFLNNLEFKNLLFVYILERIISLDLKQYSSVSFCFDNLDEVQFEYLTEDIWNDFKEVRRNLIHFFNENPQGIRFDVIGRMSFILTFREANLIIRSSHYLDRIDPYLENLRIVLTESAKRIIKKRHDILHTYFRNQLNNSSINYLVKIIVSDIYTDSFYLPLFNYDYRKLFQAIVDIGTSHKFEHYRPVSQNRYKNIYKISKRIARGTLINRFIRYLIVKDFLMEFATIPDTPSGISSKGFCRKSRMLLTIIYRCSYPDGVENNVYIQKQKVPNRKRLYDIFCSYNEMFPNDPEFFDLLERFFNIKKSSWAHLISIYNLSGEKVKSNFSDEKKILIGALSDTSELQKRLKNYEVNLNASGYIYLSHLLIHYEYFVHIVNQRANRTYKSLIEDVSYNSKQNKFEFEILIKSILKLLEKYKINIDNFISHNLTNRTDKSLDWYLAEEYVFKQSPEKSPSLYFTRVVSSHIEYLDRFRKVIFNDNIIRKAIKKHSTLEQVNIGIVNSIEEYVILLETGSQDKISPKLISIFKNRIEAVRSNRMDKFIAIEKD